MLEQPLSYDKLLALASAGEIKKAVRGFGEDQLINLPSEVVRQGYEKGHHQIRNGCSEDDAIRFLQSGLDNQEIIALLARDGFIDAALKVIDQHNSIADNPPIFSLDEDIIREGYAKSKDKIRNGYSEDDAIRFLRLGVTAQDAASLLAAEGHMGAVIKIVDEHGNHAENSPLVFDDSVIKQGYQKSYTKIRNGYSEKTALRFLMLSSTPSEFYSPTAAHGLIGLSYNLKVVCGIEVKLPDNVLNDGFKVLESKPFTGLDSIVPQLEQLVAAQQGTMLVHRSPEYMLESIAENPERFLPRLKVLQERDSKTMTDRLGRGMDDWRV